MKKDYLNFISSVLVGGALSRFTELAEWLWDKFVNHFSIQFTIESTGNEMYNWIQLWLSAEVKNKKSFSVSTKESVTLRDPRPEVRLTAGEGKYWIKWQKVWISVYFSANAAKDENSQQYGVSSSKKKSSFIVRCYTRNLRVANNFLQWIRQNYATNFDGNVKVKTPSYESWDTACTLKARPLETIIFPEGKMEEIIGDMAWFQGAEDYYIQRGIPYRRGYLFYGPPGSGKSSVLSALAGHLGMPIHLLSLSEGSVTDRNLRELIMQAGRNSLVVIEDVDCAVLNRSAKKKTRAMAALDDMDEGHSLVTLSGLLNAIDGVLAGEGRILILTTNHREKLDPALIRPGRVDVEIEVTNATKYQIKRMFLRFFSNDEDKATIFSELVPENTVSMARLQKYFMKHDTAQTALENYKELIEEKGKKKPNVD